MKKIAYWNNYTCFSNNQAFNKKAYGIGEDLGYPTILLKDMLESKGYFLETLDMDTPDKYHKIIFSDVPDPNTCCVEIEKIPKEKRILILAECEMIYKPNARTDLLNDYAVVFTYNDNLVRNFGYKKLNMVNKIKTPRNVVFSEKKFLTLIAGNKTSRDQGELYSERLKAIRFMEKKHLFDFDLYGIGWDLRTFTGIKPIRALNRFSFLRKLCNEKHPAYKGKVDRKIEVLSNYKFCFCYENSCIIPGYISEKIWDCFFAGCIPIYYGAPNISDYIPTNCFIDWRNFSNYDEIYNYLKNMSEKEYNDYIENIKNFLNSDKVYPFSAECFVDTIINEIEK